MLEILPRNRHGLIIECSFIHIGFILKSYLQRSKAKLNQNPGKGITFINVLKYNDLTLCNVFFFLQTRHILF